jgi:hypothetical protein
LIADRRMGSFFVVVVAPILHLVSGIRKAQESVCIETFRPEAAVERFDGFHGCDVPLSFSSTWS